MNDIRLDNPATFSAATPSALVRYFRARTARRHKAKFVSEQLTLSYHLLKGLKLFTFTGNGCDGIQKTPEADYRLSNMNADDDKCEDHHTTPSSPLFCLTSRQHAPSRQAGVRYIARQIRAELAICRNTCRAL